MSVIAIAHATPSGVIRDAADGKYCDVLETTPYVADNLRDDMAGRLEALSAFIDAS